MTGNQAYSTNYRLADDKDNCSMCSFCESEIKVNKTRILCNQGKKKTLVSVKCICNYFEKEETV